MVSFKKIIDQTSSKTARRRGNYREPIYRVVKTVVTPADHIRGTTAVYSEELIEISGVLAEHIQKNWSYQVTEDFADLYLTTNIKLNFTKNNDQENDEIEHSGVRYRIVEVMHSDVILFDDKYDYALREKKGQISDI